MKTLSNSEVARQAGVNPAQLGQWLATGRLERPKMAVRDGRIVWLWTEADIERIRLFKERLRHTASPVDRRPGLEAGNRETV
jgi:transposase-like protein